MRSHKQDTHSDEDSYNFEFYERLNRKERQQERIREKERRRNSNHLQNAHHKLRHRSRSSDSPGAEDNKNRKQKSHRHRRQRSSPDSHEPVPHSKQIKQAKRSRSRSRSRDKQRRREKHEGKPGHIQESSRPRLKINGGFLSSLILDNKISNRRLDEQDISRTGEKLQKSFNESRRPVTMSEYLSNQALRVVPVMNSDALLSKKHTCEMPNCRKQFARVEQLQVHLQKHKQDL